MSDNKVDVVVTMNVKGGSSLEQQMSGYQRAGEALRTASAQHKAATHELQAEADRLAAERGRTIRMKVRTPIEGEETGSVVTDYTGRTPEGQRQMALAQERQQFRSRMSVRQAAHQAEFAGAGVEDREIRRYQRIIANPKSTPEQREAAEQQIQELTFAARRYGALARRRSTQEKHVLESTLTQGVVGDLVARAHRGGIDPSRIEVGGDTGVSDITRLLEQVATQPGTPRASGFLSRAKTRVRAVKGELDRQRVIRETTQELDDIKADIRVLSDRTSVGRLSGRVRDAHVELRQVMARLAEASTGDYATPEVRQDVRRARKLVGTVTRGADAIDRGDAAALAEAARAKAADERKALADERRDRRNQARLERDQHLMRTAGNVAAVRSFITGAQGIAGSIAGGDFASIPGAMVQTAGSTLLNVGLGQWAAARTAISRGIMARATQGGGGGTSAPAPGAGAGGGGGGAGGPPSGGGTASSGGGAGAAAGGLLARLGGLTVVAGAAMSVVGAVVGPLLTRGYANADRMNALYAGAENWFSMRENQQTLAGVPSGRARMRGATGSEIYSVYRALGAPGGEPSAEYLSQLAGQHNALYRAFDLRGNEGAHVVQSRLDSMRVFGRYGMTPEQAMGQYTAFAQGHGVLRRGFQQDIGALDWTNASGLSVSSAQEAARISALTRRFRPAEQDVMQLFNRAMLGGATLPLNYARSALIQSQGIGGAPAQALVDALLSQTAQQESGGMGANLDARAAFSAEMSRAGLSYTNIPRVSATFDALGEQTIEPFRRVGLSMLRARMMTEAFRGRSFEEGLEYMGTTDATRRAADAFRGMSGTEQRWAGFGLSPSQRDEITRGMQAFGEAGDVGRTMTPASWADMLRDVTQLRVSEEDTRRSSALTGAAWNLIDNWSPVRALEGRMKVKQLLDNAADSLRMLGDGLVSGLGG